MKILNLALSMMEPLTSDISDNELVPFLMDHGIPIN
jgi:hypothetical protein